MLRWLFRKQIDAFDRTHGYDSAYVREILDADLDGPSDSPRSWA